MLRDMDRVMYLCLSDAFDTYSVMFAYSDTILFLNIETHLCLQIFFYLLIIVMHLVY